MESDAIGSSVDMGPWDSPGKNTGMGWHFLLQGIFLTQGQNLLLLYLLLWQEGSLLLVPAGKFTLSYINLLVSALSSTCCHYNLPFL